ncbi:AP-1 complex subunit mu-1, partial [Xenoophorus captivus]
MSASAVYVLDLKGKVLVCRNYRGDVDMSEIEHFMTLLMDKEEEGTLSPILAHGGVRFIYITQEGHKLDTGAPRPPATVTNAVSWRSEGIKYRKNEVFLDVIESVNLLVGTLCLNDLGCLRNFSNTDCVFPACVSANGNVLRSEIVGSIKMRVFLSGMPELRLGLNDKVLFENTGRGKSKSVELEDVKFHQCVRLSRFENDRTISFIPPDGEFELMSYRLNTHAKSQFKRRSTANNVEIHIPVPTDADSPKFKTTVGSVKWVPENSEIVWSIKSFPVSTKCDPIVS